MRPKRISIIIPALDEAETLPWLLGDLQVFRGRGHEILVVDGGSRDSTIAIAQADADRVIEAPKGRAIQLNQGARAASGEVLWFLHADSRISPESVDAIEAHCNASRPWGRFDVRLSGGAWVFRVIERMMNLRSCLTGIATGDQGIFVLREVFDRIDGVPAIALMEDVALSRRLRRLSRPVCVHAPQLQTSSRRWEQSGILRTVWLMWRLRLAYALGASPDELAARYR
jgi:rSAM/selenodomain-associated transferase 2